VTRKLLLAGRVLLGVVFLYAAYTKLVIPWQLFALSIDSYQWLPEWGVILTARVLPWAELAIGVLLVSGWLLRWTAAATAALLGAFWLLMFRAYLLGFGIDCGCFGIGQALGPGTLVRDGLLVLLAVAVTGGALTVARTKTTTGGL
jgi:uncharacterized membrane protein YphA (DoxX/SURF4 family)